MEKTVTHRTYNAICHELAKGFADVHGKLLELQDIMATAASMGKKVHGAIALKEIVEMMDQNSDAIMQAYEFSRFFDGDDEDEDEEDEG